MMDRMIRPGFEAALNDLKRKVEGAGLNAVLIPNGESASKAVAAAGGERSTVKPFCAVGSSAPGSMESATKATTSPAKTEAIFMTSAGRMPAAHWNGKCSAPRFLTDLTGGKTADNQAFSASGAGSRSSPPQ